MVEVEEEDYMEDMVYIIREISIIAIRCLTMISEIKEDRIIIQDNNKIIQTNLITVIKI